MNIPSRMEHFNVPGVSATWFADGELTETKCYGELRAGEARPVDAETVFHACSISKMITAMTVLRMMQDGILSLHDDVNAHLSSWQVPANEYSTTQPVTLANLLAHQGGFLDPEGSFSPVPEGEAAPSSLEILQGISPYHQGPVAPQYTPGTDWEYSDAGYTLINQVVLDVTGVPVTEWSAHLIFQPLGLRHTFFWEAGGELPSDMEVDNVVVGHGNEGEEIGETRAFYPNTEGAQLWTTTEDLAHICIDLINSYQSDSGKVLHQSSARLMLSPFGSSTEGLGVFSDVDAQGRKCFFSQGWGVGAQCKLEVCYDIPGGSGVVVMTNSEPGMEQDESLVGEIIRGGQ